LKKKDFTASLAVLMLASAARDCTATASFSEALGLCWNIMKIDKLKYIL
jgi:hypothetical protein